MYTFPGGKINEHAAPRGKPLAGHCAEPLETDRHCRFDTRIVLLFSMEYDPGQPGSRAGGEGGGVSIDWRAAAVYTRGSERREVRRTKPV
jgi:hypothetical protein